MNIARYIRTVKEHYNNPDRKEVLEIVAKNKSQWQNSFIPLNDKIEKLSTLIGFLERNFTYMPESLYKTLVKFSMRHKRIVYRNFRQEYSHKAA